MIYGNNMPKHSRLFIVSEAKSSYDRALLIIPKSTCGVSQTVTVRSTVTDRTQRTALPPTKKKMGKEDTGWASDRHILSAQGLEKPAGA